MAHDNPSRDAILSRIRSALAKPALPCEPASRDIDIFPKTSDLLQCLETELAASGVGCILTTSNESAAALWAQICALPPGEVFVQDAPELRSLLSVGDSSHQLRWSSKGSPAENSVATITLAEVLVASTGSIMVSSACGGRSGSIVAPCHIVYAKTSQIVPDLEAAMEHIHRTGMLKNSLIGFITGASRTGDIEKIVVHGAHGPRKVVVVLERA